MKLTQLETPKPAVKLNVYDFFVSETRVCKAFDLRQVVRTENGYGILRVRDGRVFSINSETIAEALAGYVDIHKVKLEEVTYILK